eukprot:NODE_2_length_91304_cov_0.692462.p35 type:complete len:282 gc:universal NODE_2_length_91304_cov_0.692462:86408-87253(+)
MENIRRPLELYSKNYALHEVYNPCQSNGYYLRDKHQELIMIRNRTSTIDGPLFYIIGQEGVELKLIDIFGRLKCPGCCTNHKSFKDLTDHVRLSFVGKAKLIDLGVDVVLAIFSYKDSRNYWSCAECVRPTGKLELEVIPIPIPSAVNPVYRYKTYLNIKNAWNNAFNNFCGEKNENFYADPRALLIHIYSVSMDTILSQLHIPTSKPTNSFIFILLTCHIGVMLVELDFLKYYKILLLELYSKRMISLKYVEECIKILSAVKSFTLPCKDEDYRKKTKYM